MDEVDVLIVVEARLKTARRLRTLFGLTSPFAILLLLLGLEGLRSESISLMLAAWSCLAIWTMLPVAAGLSASSVEPLLPTVVTSQTLPLFLEALVCPSASVGRRAADAVARSVPLLHVEDLGALVSYITWRRRRHWGNWWPVV